MSTKGTRAANVKVATTPRVGIYVRMSVDKSGDALGVKRQEKEARALCARKGWTVVKVYKENDTSASGKVERPVYLQMLDDVRTGQITGIVAWAFDRLTRSMRELEDIIDLHDETGCELATIEGEIDLGTEVGRMIARILGAVARAELETRRKRQLAERRQTAEDGGVHTGGKHRPFGYAADRLTIVETEAAVIVEATKRVLAGESLRSVAEDLHRRGITGTTGTPFNATRLRQVLISARISGRRDHWQQKTKGEKRPALPPIVSTKTEWKRIITVKQSDALRELLTNDARRSNPGNARKHLLPGFIECGNCKRSMQSHNVGGAAGYVCSLTTGQKCRKSIRKNLVEDVVILELLGEIDKPAYRKLLHQRAGVSTTVLKQLGVDEKRLVELAVLEETKVITSAEWRAKRDVVKARIDEATKVIAANLRNAALTKLLDQGNTKVDIETRWEKLTLAEQRSVLGAAVKRVVVHPSVPSGPKFDPRRVELVWAA